MISNARADINSVLYSLTLLLLILMVLSKFGNIWLPKWWLSNCLVALSNSKKITHQCLMGFDIFHCKIDQTDTIFKFWLQFALTWHQDCPIWSNLRPGASLRGLLQPPQNSEIFGMSSALFILKTQNRRLLRDRK